jgi:hypothetical protein
VQRDAGSTVPDFASLDPDYGLGEPRSMARFFLKHLLFLGLTLVVVSFLVFVLTERTPGMWRANISAPMRRRRTC